MHPTARRCTLVWREPSSLRGSCPSSSTRFAQTSDLSRIRNRRLPGVQRDGLISPLDSLEPLAGDLFYYLIRVENACPGFNMGTGNGGDEERRESAWPVHDQRGRIAMNRKSIWLAVALGGLVLFGATADSRAAEAVEIGMVHFGSVELGGAILSSGEVVLDQGLVRTELGQAIVHLDNGQVLKLEGNSAAHFEAAAFGEINVTVLSGRVIKWSAKGRPLSAGAGSRFTIGRSAQDPMVAERALLGVAPLTGADPQSSSKSAITGR